MHTNRYLRSILSILLCFICFGLQAQSLKVSLFFNGKSPFISDWISGTNSAWLTISNNGQTDRDFKVYTELFYNGEKVANTDNSKMQVVTLAAGENIKVLAEDFYSLSAVNYYGSFNVMGVAMSGKVPGGTYMFCSKLVDKTTGEELTAAQCKTFNITDYTLTLVSPFNSATLTKAEAANLNFSFVMAPKYAGIATYGLKIYELLDRQDVAQALNNVPFYEAEFKNKQSFRYPLDAPKFQEGKKYVWVVYDYNEKGTPVTQNGRSEYFVFNVGNGVLRSTITAHVTVGSIKCAGKDAEGRQVYSVTLNYQNNTGTGTPNHLGVTSVGPPYSFLPTNGIYWSVPSANATISGIAPAATSPGIAIPDGSTIPITFNISSNATSAIVQIKSCNIDADQMNRANGEDNVVLNFPPCDSCHCGKWTNDDGGAGATVHQGAYTVNVMCNKGTKGYNTCSPITITSKLVCEGKCDPSYTRMDVNGPVSYSGAIGTFNPTIQGTYVIRLTGICGKDTCVCMFDMYVDSCNKPKCTCDSNTAWYTTPFIFNSMNYSKPATCGQTITLPAGSYNFILPTFNCKPGTCTATYPWTVNGVWQSGTGKVKTHNFVSGTYIITFAPMCGTDTCTKCTVTIVIEDSSCNCYKWLSKKVQVVSKSGTQTKACGGVFDVKVNTVVNFTFPGYQCSKTICKPTYDYSIAGGSAATGIGNKFPYTFAACGTYTVTARAYCNGHLCDSCKAIINVTGCDSCNCGTWVKMQVSQQGSSTQPVKCGGGVEGYTTCGPVFVNAFLNCVGDCKAKDVQMTVTGPIGFTPVTAVVPGSFVPTLPGSYLVTMTGKCGDKICKCDFKIYVTKCKDTICECGEWAEIKVGQEGSTVKYAKCGGTIEGYTTCGPVNVSALLNCNGDCKAKDLMMSVTGPVGFTPVSTSVAGSFTPNISGVYVVSLKGKCGENICKCQFKIIVKACCDCGEWDKDPGSITYYDGVKKVKKELHCGEKYGLAYDGYPIVVNKNYICNGKCKATYDWQLINTATNTVVTGGTDVAMPIKFVVKEPGCYKMVITAKCGGKICASCEITICTSECCTDWGKIIYNLNGSASSSIPCGGTIQADQTDVVNVAGSYTCNTTFDCKSQTTTSVYLPDGTLYSQAPGLTFTFPKPGTIPVCGLYKVVFTAKCGNQICQVCTFFINVDCCGKRHIARVDKKGEPIKESGCIQPGTYTFNLIPGLLPGTPISYQLVTKPDNATIASGTYSYSATGMPFTIPPYLCGAKTGFELTFTWNDGKCHDVFKGEICDSPCCYFIRYMGTTNRSLSSNIYKFKTSFAVPAGIAISQVKVQLIESRDGITPTPKANIQELIVNAVSPTGLVSQAITTPGSGIWFGTLTGIPTLLEFQGKVINEPGLLATTHMIIRYTFYAKNGNCVAEICEQNIEYGKGK